MFAIYVTINVKPNCMEKFLAACIEEGKASVRDEPDCLRFEILRDKNDPNRVCFMEVFKDEQSLQTHWETPHFTEMWDTIEDMIDARAGETDLWNSIEQVDMDFVYSSDDSLDS
jgi:quinol monooxygenase YgiN